MDSTLACLAAWMPRQRWYAAKGRPPSLRLVSWWDLPAPADEPEARIRTYLVADEGALPVVLYQLPVVARATETVVADPDHVIGSPEPGTVFIDGPHDAAYAHALLRLVVDGGRAEGPQTTVQGHPSGPAPELEARSTRVMSGEQSNSSLVYEGRGAPMICKVYRRLEAGTNPDIVLQTALADAGSTRVPRPIGWVQGTWTDLSTTHGSMTGALAFAQEFLPGVEDAWRVALLSAANGEDFRPEARELGAATAEVHVALARCFPTRAATAADREAAALGWRRRLAIAIAEVPEIAGRREAIEDVYRRALDVPWPVLQRIHGDLHLGQVLHAPGRGWIMLDFEGEPLRPMAERADPDVTLRDVAGMLRSFDYVAGSLRREEPDRSLESIRAWARAARGAFLEGYALTWGAALDPRHPLLAALELDKAVYEATYEARNRPTWVAIPLAAISRLADRPAPVG